MRALNVVMLIDELERWGGTETHLRLLLDHLDPELVRPVLAIIGGTTLAPHFRDRGIAVHPLEIHRALAPSGLVGVGRIAALLGRERASLLVTYHTAADLLGPLAAQLRRLPVLSCRRDDGFTKKPVHVVLQRRINHLLTGMISVSNFVAREVQRVERFPLHRNRVIWNGEDLDRFTPGPSPLRQELGLDPEACILTCVGSLAPVKNHETQLEALSQLSRLNPHLCLVLVGDGPARARLEQLARPLGAHVRFLGHRDDVPDILRGSDLYLQTSLTEGFSNAVLQAMATALPVVATAVGGNLELVTPDCGALVPLRNPVALSDTLARLIASPARRHSLGRAGRARALARCSLAAMTAHYQDAFQAAAARRFRGALAP